MVSSYLRSLPSCRAKSEFRVDFRIRLSYSELLSLTSIEFEFVRVRMVRTIAQRRGLVTSEQLDRAPGRLDLALAVDSDSGRTSSCAPRSRASLLKKHKYEI